MPKKHLRLPKLINKVINQEKVNKPFDQTYYHEPGTVPGTIIIDENAEQPNIFLVDYNQTSLTQKQIKYPEECSNYLDTESVSWVDVQGLGNKEIIHRGKLLIYIL